MIPGVDVGEAIVVANHCGRERRTGHQHGLIEARVAVSIDVDAIGVLARTVEVHVGEVAAVAHAEALHEFVGGNGTALTETVEGESCPTPTPAVLALAVDHGVTQVLCGMNIEDFLVASLVVAIAIGAAEGHAIAAFVLRLGLYELVVVAIGGIIVKEVIAILQAALPQRGVFLAEPHVFLVLKAGGLLGGGHVRLVAVEQRRGGKHPNLRAKGTGRGLCQASRPLADVGVGNAPDEAGLVDGTLNKRVDELDGLPSGGTAFGEVLTHGEGFLHEAQAAEVAEGVVVAACHDGISLTAQTALLGFRHVGHLLDILDNLPALAHGFVNRDTATSITRQTACLR